MPLQTYTANCWPGVHPTVLLDVRVNGTYFEDAKKRPYCFLQGCSHVNMASECVCVHASLLKELVERLVLSQRTADYMFRSTVKKGGVAVGVAYRKEVHNF